MARPKKTPFTEALESVLLNVWGSGLDRLDDNLVKKTRKAVVEIRGIYRFKGDFPGKYPSNIQYRLAKNRAGYLAAFGQRHAYLTYAHMQMVDHIDPKVIPTPQPSKRELVVTMLGAGAAIEVYGLCYFYNQDTQELRRLRLNLVDKENAWKSNRHTVFDKVLKGTFPKVDIVPNDIDADLTDDCVPRFADSYDDLRETDILLIYNVMNEIDTRHVLTVWKNIDFLLRISVRPLLILLMEPSVRKARPRVRWLKARLCECTDLLLQSDEQEILFHSHPMRIDYEHTNEGLNDRLFRHVLDGTRPPTLETSVRRSHIACRRMPSSPIPIEQVYRQLATLDLKRGQKGRFVRQAKPQQSFWQWAPDWDKTG